MSYIIGDIMLSIWLGATVLLGIIVTIEIIKDKRKDKTSKLPITSGETRQ